jgi:hypothetical protein
MTSPWVERPRRVTPCALLLPHRMTAGPRGHPLLPARSTLYASLVQDVMPSSLPPGGVRTAPLTVAEMIYYPCLITLPLLLEAHAFVKG